MNLMQKNQIGFEFYFNIYNCGQKGILTQESFGKYVHRALSELRAYCRLSETELSSCDEVRLCVCEVADIIFCAENTDFVKSETIDGYSVTFGSKGDKTEKIRRCILTRLKDTGLLYAGVE